MNHIRRYTVLIGTLICVFILNQIGGHKIVGMIFWGGPGLIFSALVSLQFHEKRHNILHSLGFALAGTMMYLAVFWATFFTSIFGLLFLTGLGALALMALIEKVYSIKIEKNIKIASAFAGAVSYGLPTTLQIFEEINYPIFLIICIWWVYVGLLLALMPLQKMKS